MIHDFYCLFHYLQGFIHPRWCRIAEPSAVRWRSILLLTTWTHSKWGWRFKIQKLSPSATTKKRCFASNYIAQTTNHFGSSISLNQNSPTASFAVFFLVLILVANQMHLYHPPKPRHYYDYYSFQKINIDLVLFRLYPSYQPFLPTTKRIWWTNPYHHAGKDGREFHSNSLDGLQLMKIATKKQSNSKISWLDIRIPTDVRCLGMFVVWVLGPHTSSPGVWMSRVCRLNTKSFIHAWPNQFQSASLTFVVSWCPTMRFSGTKNWLLLVGYIHLSYISQHSLNTTCFTNRHCEFVILHNYMSILLVCSGFDWTT